MIGKRFVTSHKYHGSALAGNYGLNSVEHAAAGMLPDHHIMFVVWQSGTDSRRIAVKAALLAAFRARVHAGAAAQLFAAVTWTPACACMCKHLRDQGSCAETLQGKINRKMSPALHYSAIHEQVTAVWLEGHAMSQ